MKAQRLTWWQGLVARRATRADYLIVLLLLALAAASVSSGAASARKLSPATASDLAASIARLRVPEGLPDVRLRGEAGNATTLMKQTGAKPALVVVVGPLGLELKSLAPWLRDSLEDGILLIVSGRADARQTLRQRLDELGLERLRYFVDDRHGLVSALRTRELPRSFLIDGSGAVLSAVVGDDRRWLDRLRFLYGLEAGWTP